jgi:hypothetical protein
MFLDGPLEGTEHDWIFLGEWQRELWYMPDPFKPGWILIGRDGLAPDPPWDGQVHYRRVDERSQLLPNIPPGENEGWACYKLAEETTCPTGTAAPTPDH